jgi:hypothetical protein
MRIEEIQKRNRINKDGLPAEYAVFSVFHFDRFDECSLLKRAHVSKSPGKKITIMCFLPGLYNQVERGKTYMFKGFVSFGYGNTFLVTEEIITQAGEVLSSWEEDDTLLD